MVLIIRKDFREATTCEEMFSKTLQIKIDEALKQTFVTLHRKMFLQVLYFNTENPDKNNAIFFSMLLKISRCRALSFGLQFLYASFQSCSDSLGGYFWVLYCLETSFFHLYFSGYKSVPDSAGSIAFFYLHYCHDASSLPYSSFGSFFGHVRIKCYTKNAEVLLAVLVGFIYFSRHNIFNF